MRAKRDFLVRMLDANANRAAEGLRVTEDFARFGLDAQAAMRRLKAIRHGLVRELERLPVSLSSRLRFRDARHDVGKNSGREAVRLSHEVLLENIKRVQESLRVLEEISRALQPSACASFERLRYLMYEMEKELVPRFQKFLRENKKIHGVYFIADMDSAGERKLLSVTKEALRAGVNVLQLRFKSQELKQVAVFAKQLHKEAKKSGVPFLVNDRVDAAAWLDADGVHLGQEDMPVFQARKILGASKIIGVSAHNVKEAQKAQRDGADYVAVGPVFPTQTKKDARPVAGVGKVKIIKQSVRVPVVAIGGINESNARRAARGGKADAVAVISAITASRHVGLTVKKLKNAFLTLLFLCASSFPTASFSQGFNSDLMNARAFSSQGQFVESAAAYEKALAGPLPVETMQRVTLEYAFVLERLGRFMNEVDALKKAFEADKGTPVSGELCQQIGSLYNRLNKIKEAREALTQCAALYPEHPAAYGMKMLLAQIYEREGKIEESAQVLKKMWESAPDENERLTARSLLLELYFRAKDMDAAKRVLEAGVKQSPDDISLSFRLVDVYEHLADYEKALALYEKLEKTAYDAVFPKKLQILKKLGRLGEEEAKLKNELAKNKTVPKILRLAQVYAFDGKFADALVLLEKAAKDFPSDGNVSQRLASAYQQNKDYEKALQIYNALLAKNPGNVSYYKTVGEIHASAGRKNEAVAAWKKFFFFNPKDAGSVMNVAAFLHDKAFYEEALQIYLEGRAGSGNNFLFAQQVAQIYRILMEKESALDEAVKWLANDAGALDMAVALMESMELKPADRDTVILLLLGYSRSFPQNKALARAASMLALKNGNAQKAYDAAFAVTGHKEETCLMLYGLLQGQGKENMEKETAAKALLELCDGTHSAVSMGVQMARRFVARGDHKEAQALIESLLAKVSEAQSQALLKMLLAQSYEGSGDGSKARALYEAMLSQKDGAVTADTFFAYGNLLLRAGEYEKAQGIFEKAQSAPGFVSQDKLLLAKAECAYFQGKFEESKKQYENLIQLYPQSPYKNDALSRLNILKNGEPENIKVLFEVEKLQALKNYNEAETKLLFFVENKKSSAILREAYFLLGGNYEVKQEFGKALFIYQQMLTLFEEGAWTEDVQEKIRKLQGAVKG